MAGHCSWLGALEEGRSSFGVMLPLIVGIAAKKPPSKASLEIVWWLLDVDMILVENDLKYIGSLLSKIGTSKSCFPHLACVFCISDAQLWHWVESNFYWVVECICWKACVQAKFARLYLLSQTQAPPSEKPPPRPALGELCLSFWLRQVLTS